ncbi:hypothetical protein Arnit_2848 [Arcobacter nitrofigilis DSM 7299]|uniref:Uncharacterized protein n=1 Tax=Arcobacter nitrofigilis (strain ATCC 33309 / DSM 7299 / CCUG 15893 / LMG 7604 / NCTC 12251 / CI) TaxID=572480 RepID=D5V776_ARCNC|nr:hypothetical protein [Arcobacter nitrofigilis]ADG94496.1 hypothetical protein Arnit_2848 [Arcobacter nitrofigilis DSM 7299]
MNKIFKKIVFILIFSTTLFAQESITVGILYNKIFEDKNKAEIAVKVFLKQITNKSYGHNFKVKFYEDGKKLLNDYVNKKVTNIVIDPEFYYKNKKFIDKYKDYSWGMSQSDEIFDQYYLIKNINAESNLDSSTIKNIYYNDASQKIWLEYLTYKNKVNTLKKLKNEQKASKNLLEVFFKKDCISVVTKDLYNSMVKINPQIKRQVKIIKKSKQIFLTAIGFARKDLSKGFYEFSNIMNKDFGNNKDKLKIFAFANVKKIYFFKNDDPKLQDLNDFYLEYFKLKSK